MQTSTAPDTSQRELKPDKPLVRTWCAVLAAPLRAANLPACVHDGDILRQGLCDDLGFSSAAREENMPRAAHMACLLNDNGSCAIVAMISPTRAGREKARAIIGAHRFIVCFIATPLHICQQRDPKGLYARAATLPNFALTGVSAPFDVLPALKDQSSQVKEFSRKYSGKCDK
jgi:adenylylsulfate kinase-like enzyme